MNRTLRTTFFLALATLLIPTLPGSAWGGANDLSAQRPGGARPGAGGESDQEAEPKGYADVITDEAVTKAGMFTVHRVDDKLYFEIPEGEFEKEQLLIQRPVESTLISTSGFLRGGPRLIVWWEKHGDKRVVLRVKDYDVIADTDSAIWGQVQGYRKGPILASFAIEATSPEGNTVIDVSDLFISNIPELEPLEGLQRDRSWVEDFWAFEGNVNVEVTQTGQSRPPAGANAGGGNPFAQQARGPQTQTARVHFSMLRLPEQPMMPRWHDERVGFNSSRYIDFSRPEQEAKELRYIHRFRLEKKNPTAAVSDPVEPIVYWIDPATPDWLKPWVVSGVNQWQEAFEEAGFSNAIFGRIAPTAEEDPDFSLYDAGKSVIYWRPSTVPNATGGQVVDPRSGEILKGEVNMYHNIMDLLTNWYYIQASPNDPRALTLPLEDDIMGKFLEYVVTHEIGHSIGFPHNMKASSQYPADSLRSREFLERMGGHVSTLMDYSRMNYVAQPEDNIPVELLMPRVGPYDKFAVNWGYAVIDGADTPDAEKAQLDEWIELQNEFPWLRFTTPDATNDFGNLTEAVGDADAVKSSGYGLKNLQRVMDSMLETAEQPNQSYDLLEELYGQAVGQWGRYMGHVSSIVGAAYTQEKYGTGPRFTPMEKERQEEAVKFLIDNAFQRPDMLLDDEILFRIESEGAVARIRTAQARVLGQLMNQDRLDRLVEYGALEDSDDVYTLIDLMDDMREGLFGEFNDRTVRTDIYRRNLQRAYLNALDERLHPSEEDLNRPASRFNPPATAPWATDARAVIRSELNAIDQMAARGIGSAGDEMTRLHLEDLRIEIDRILSTDR